MTKKEARERVAFFAYSLVDTRLCTDDRIYPKDATEEDMKRLDAALEDLLDVLYRRAGKTVRHFSMSEKQL